MDLPPNSQEKQGATENQGATVDSFDRPVTSRAETEGHTTVPFLSPFSRLVGKTKGQRSGDGYSVGTTISASPPAPVRFYYRQALLKTCSALQVHVEIIQDREKVALWQSAHCPYMRT